MKRMFSIVILMTVVALTFGGCRSKGPRAIEDRLLTELSGLDKEEIFAKGETLYQDEKFKQARRYYSFLYDTFPNDPLGHKAALRIADSYAAYNDGINLTEARLRYRDFVNRYPNDPDRAYALMMLGDTYYRRRGKADRDLEFTREGISSFEQMLALYPDSEHASEAREKLEVLYGMLAEHEYLVAYYYSRAGRLGSALRRLEYLEETYPDWPRMAEARALEVKVKSTLDEQYEKLNRRRATKGMEPLKPQYLRDDDEAEAESEDAKDPLDEAAKSAENPA